MKLDSINSAEGLPTENIRNLKKDLKEAGITLISEINDASKKFSTLKENFINYLDDQSVFYDFETAKLKLREVCDASESFLKLEDLKKLAQSKINIIFSEDNQSNSSKQGIFLINPFQ